MLDLLRSPIALTARRRLSALTLSLSVAALTLAACATAERAPPAADAPARVTELGGYLASRQAERERDYGAAANFILQTLKDNPNDYDMLVRAETFLIADGRFPQAVEIAQRTLKLQPGHPLSSLVLAIDAARRNDFAAAKTMVDGQALNGVNRVVIPLMSAWIEEGLNRPAAALNALRPVAEINGFRALYEYHAALINDLAGRAAEAEDHYKKSLDIEGGPPARLIEAEGNFYERGGKRDAAQALYQRFQVENRDSAAITAASTRAAGAAQTPAPLVPSAVYGMSEALFNVAGALRQENSQPTPLIYAQLALALTPDLPVGLLFAADVLDSYGRRDQANALYARIPVSSPLAWSAHIRVAENANAMGRTDDAIKQLEAMAAAQPDRLEPLLSLGQILRAKERYADSAKIYDRAIARINPDEPRYWSLYYARGIAFERSKQWPRAEADFLHALKLAPEQPDVMNYLAYSWVDQGIKERFVESQRMLERAVQLRPDSGEIVDSLGWVLYRTGQYPQAAAVLERAVEMVPEDPTLLNHLGDAYWRVGRLNEARFQWQRALLHKPEPDLRVEIERKLERGMEPLARQGS